MRRKERKIIMINKKFQIKLIIKFIVLNIILLLIFSIISHMFLNSEIETQLNRAHITFKNVQNMLFPIILTLSILNIIVASVTISIFVMLASFRIAGPLYRFNEALKQLARKNLNPVTSLRKDDQLYECSKTLAETVNVISTDMHNIKEKVNTLKIKIKKNDLKTISDDIEKLSSILDEYKA